MKSFRHLLCTLLLCLPASLQAAEPRNALFGVELGTRFQFPACARNQDALTDHHCHNAAQKTKTPWGTEEHRVFYPRPKVIPWARGELLVETAGGIIVAIHVNTWGIQGQGTALEDLTRKYGEPTRQRSEKITGQRSRFPSKFAEWQLKDLWVNLEGTTSTVDWGRVTLATPDYRKRATQQTKKP
jgi:hypothetical protein